MPQIDISREILQKLKLLEKYSYKVTVTPTSLVTSNIKIILDKFCDCEFTVNIREFLMMLDKTGEFKLTNKLEYSYEIDVGGLGILINRKIKLYEDRFDIPYADPRFSIVVPHFPLLSCDDHTILVQKCGTFEISSENIIKTKTEFKNLNVVFNEVDSFKVKVKYKDLQVIEEFKKELVFSFFDDHLLIHILESPNTTNIFLIPVLVDT